MKIILPMGGLAILSSLFLFSKSHQPGEVIPGFEGGFSEIAGKERLSGPKFAGMTDSGIAIQLSAAQASPRIAGGAIFDATDLAAEVETRNGDKIEISAGEGMIDSANMLASLKGGIRIDTSLGYTIETEGLTIALDKMEIRSLGRITAEGPLGTITAGELFLGEEHSGDGTEKGGYLLVFKGGAKLVYIPR